MSQESNVSSIKFKHIEQQLTDIKKLIKEQLYNVEHKLEMLEAKQSKTEKKVNNLEIFNKFIIGCFLFAGFVVTIISNSGDWFK